MPVTPAHIYVCIWNDGAGGWVCTYSLGFCYRTLEPEWERTAFISIPPWWLLKAKRAHQHLSLKIYNINNGEKSAPFPPLESPNVSGANLGRDLAPALPVWWLFRNSWRFATLHKHKTIHPWYGMQGRMTAQRSPLGCDWFTPRLTLYQAHEKSLTNHFAGSSQHSSPTVLCWLGSWRRG